MSKSSQGDRLLRGISVVGLTGGWAISATVSSGNYPNWGITALSLLLAGVIAITILAILSAMRTVREWRALEVDTIGVVGQNMARWYDTVCRIQKTYSYEQISFAKRYISGVAAQARGRLSLFIGALEKVGLISILASTAVTFVNFNRDGTIPLVWCSAVAIAGLFYFFAMRLVDIVFMLERFSLILEHAATNQQRSFQSKAALGATTRVSVRQPWRDLVMGFPATPRTQCAPAYLLTDVTFFERLLWTWELPLRIGTDA